MFRRGRFVFYYFVLDIVAAFLAWSVLYYVRKVFIENESIQQFSAVEDKKFFVGLIIIPQIWIALYYFSGTYTDVFRKSRLQEFLKTLFISTLGSVIIFFAFLLDDLVKGYSDYYISFFTLLFAQILFSVAIRMIYLNFIKSLLRKGRIVFNSLIIGSKNEAIALTEVLNKKSTPGYRSKGIVATNEEEFKSSPEFFIGSLSDIDALIENNEIEEAYIAIETNQHELLGDIIHKIGDRNVFIKIVPDMYDILSRTVRMNHVIGEAFIEISPIIISEWERIMKRWFDVIANTHRVFPSAGATNASASLVSGALKLGVGGATALDTQISRTAANTLTIDNNASGAANLIVTGNLQSQGAIYLKTVSKVFADSPYSVAASDTIIFCNATGGNMTVTLPSAASHTGRNLTVKRINTTANTVTVGSAAGTIDGAASYIIPGGTLNSITVVSDGTNWYII
jgi:hypothetical protein